MVNQIFLKNVRLLERPPHADKRGKLCAVEEGDGLSFAVKRVYWSYDTPANAKRGGHAHKESWQAHFCIGGSARITLDDGANVQTFVLDQKNLILEVGPMVWNTFELSEGAALVVLASNTYDRKKDYIEDYDEFKRLATSAS